MHEASIAMSVLDIAEKHCREAGSLKIDIIRLRIGQASSVMPEALLFAFEALKKDTMASGAELLIEAVPLGGSCRGCGKDFKAEAEAAYVLQCPLCGSGSFTINKGHEMDFVDMEVDD